MTKFIAVPKNDAAIATLSTGASQFNKDARQSQTETLIQRRGQLTKPFQSEQLRDALGGGLAASANPDFPVLPVTGIAVLEAEETRLEELRQSLPEFDVIEDVPLTLVNPVKTRALAADTEELDVWHLDATQVMRARSSGFSGRGASVGVAILDTGVEEVSELTGKIASNFEYVASTETTAEIDAPKDTDGHGTHVAGIVAGKTVGLAPEAELMNYIMIPGGLGNLSNFIFAIEFVAICPEISVLNMSAGIRGYNAGMQQAVSAARSVGLLPVIAIGNEGPNSSRSPGNYSQSFSVGASTKSDRVASFSGGGTMVVNAQSYTVPDLVAPGQEITSCVMDGGYEAWDGTSMATPVVSGIAALIIEQMPNISEPELRGEIVDALRRLPHIPSERQGGGLVQLPNHLWYASS